MKMELQFLSSAERVDEAVCAPICQIRLVTYRAHMPEHMFLAPAGDSLFGTQRPGQPGSHVEIVMDDGTVYYSATDAESLGRLLVGLIDSAELELMVRQFPEIAP